MTNPVVIGNATLATRIYALCDFPSETVRYVGKTIQPLRLRLLAHQRMARRNPRLPVTRWLAKRERAGLNVCIKWIETIDDSRGWAEREAHWIAHYRAQGAELLNLTAGGEGLPGHRFTAEHKAKIAAALRKGRMHVCPVCDREFWRKPKDAKSARLFCSRRCSNKRMRGLFDAS